MELLFIKTTQAYDYGAWERGYGARGRRGARLLPRHRARARPPHRLRERLQWLPGGWTLRPRATAAG
jgi:hypothetical protein